MRDVRRRERLAGLKRTSRQNRGQNPSKVVDNNEQTVVIRTSSQSSRPALLGDPKSLLPAIFQRDRPDRWSAGYPLPLHSTPNPPRKWFLDPFFTLPGTTKLASVVAPLLYHCKWYHSQISFCSRSAYSRLSRLKLTIGCRENSVCPHDIPEHKSERDERDGADGPNLVLGSRQFLWPHEHVCCASGRSHKSAFEGL